MSTEGDNRSREGSYEDSDDEDEELMENLLAELKQNHDRELARANTIKKQELQEKERALDNLRKHIDDTKRKKAIEKQEKGYNDFVEIQKSLVAVILWVGISIAAVWSRGVLLSLAAAFVSESLDQAALTLNAIKRGIVKDVIDKLIFTASTIVCVLNGGLILAAASSATEEFGQQMTVTLLAASQLLGVLYWAYLSHADAKDFKTYTEYVKKKALPTEFQSSSEFDNIGVMERIVGRPQNNDTVSQMASFTVIAFAVVTFVPSFTIAGTAVKESDDMNWKLILLAIGTSASLTWVLALGRDEEEIASHLFIEMVWLVARLGTKILPVALELSIEEDVDNPNALKVAAWTSYGLLAVALCAVGGEQLGFYQRPDFENTSGHSGVKTRKLKLPPASANLVQTNVGSVPPHPSRAAIVKTPQAARPTSQPAPPPAATRALEITAQPQKTLQQPPSAPAGSSVAPSIAPPQPQQLPGVPGMPPGATPFPGPFQPGMPGMMPPGMPGMHAMPGMGFGMPMQPFGTHFGM